ncbi:TPA: hypothetical protein DCZ81_00660 [Candidatus Collierbacteria bacterium]|nr:hypothetical protein [Candidatus Collierbacteria bacterium]
MSLGQNEQVSRRDFLKLSASGVLGLALSRLGVDGALARESSYRLVHGVEVYGLDEKIDTLEKAKNLTFEFDLDFERKLPKDIKSKNRWEQREYAMPKDKRLFQFVVNESIYHEYSKQKAKTGVDFVEYIQIHLDLMNRFSKQQPGLENFRTELKRVIVVSDDFKRNPVEYSKDIDAMWFNVKDERYEEKAWNYYQWQAERQESGDLILTTEEDRAMDSYKESVVLPKADDLLQSISDRGVGVNWALIHELSHHWNLPDEYVFDCRETPFKFKDFRYGTWSFTRPYLSPYLKALLFRNKKENIRGYYTDPRSMELDRDEVSLDFYGQVPQEVSFQLSDAGNFKVYRSSHVKPDYYSAKIFSDVQEVSRSPEGNFVWPKESLEPLKVEGKKLYSTVYVIRTSDGEKNKELYFPVSLFNIPAIFGVKKANYKIEFTGYEPDSAYAYTQVMEYVEASEMPVFMAKKSQTGEPIYALMAIPGTQEWAVWSLVRDL